jgi:hypothetical protein
MLQLIHGRIFVSFQRSFIFSKCTQYLQNMPISWKVGIPIATISAF